MNQEKIGSYIKKLRKEKGLTQQELADAIHVERTNVNKWENGKANLTQQNLKNIADFFDVPEIEIIAGKRVRNVEEVRGSLLELYNNNIKLSKIIKIIIFIFIFVIFIFLIYFFFTFFNSVKIYNVSIDNENISITNSSLVMTRDYISFYLDISNEEDVKGMNVYYLNEDDKEYIIQTTNLKNIYIRDRVDYQEYFDFGNLKYILNNLYVEIKLDNKTLTGRLLLNEEYTNKRIFFKRDKGCEKIDQDSMIYQKNIWKDLFEKFGADSQKIKHNNKVYTVNVFESEVDVNYKSGKKDIYIQYRSFNGIYIHKTINNEEYYYIKYNEKRANDEQENDYQLLMNLVEILREK